MPKAETEPTFAIELYLPQRVIRHLDALAEKTGRDRNGVIVELLEATRPLTLAEVVRPLHENFRQSGLKEEEVDALIEEEVKAVRAERRARQTP
jgi:hypothetical protein